ncbi:MAG TPA: acetate--CoA ligase [Deltaproteobacteria bacterium]|nr:acetate--CoA ligase [Candidatus Lambdaproteobacteria bacterium]HIN48512.1 acetate--CoA ligase [Deltaproteobacteria bacterium]HIA56134.1 acetate--CoA ligase [Candidatus Lambdaproteobacteria bacterium]HIB93458.1 acetate--CoA ligase [Candidatus Lambdaproteobacteria bacterium]HIO11445.1 acetate--CoA ligase [Deltaproteobacteria bacterium]
MNEQKIFEIPAATKAKTWIDNETYLKMYEESVNDPKGFWDKQAERLDWFRKWDNTLDWDYNKGHVRWYEGGKLNVSYNCLDRHLEKRGEQTALIWESDDPNVDRSFTYKELHTEVCKFANVMKTRGIEKGDRVMIYMPMIPELAIACLACTRIGAVHSVVFGGFSAEALKNRIIDCGGKMLITANAGTRGGKSVPLKQNADEAMEGTNTESCIVVKHTGDDCNMKSVRDFFYHEEMANSSSDCPAEEMDAEDPLFILYTSGSTGKPKGVLHTTAGYLVYTSITHQYVFDYHDGDIYWCTADIGWVTGHSYILYGPLSNGATTIMFEGVPNYPDFGRFWDICDKHKVNIFYTAPTAIRAIAKEGDELVKKRNLSSLRLLGTVGEPINPEAWLWYHRVVGHENCPIVDTWWQTETGGIMITPLPGATRTKPGSATRPFFGIQPLLVDADGNELEGAAGGNLCIKHPWPGQMRTVYGDHERFIQTYFSTYKGLYFTGDGCRRDEDGYYWITGRVDDVLNVSGHRMGTAELESAVVLHESVAEAAIVGFPHEIKGQGIYAYVTLNSGVEPTDDLKKELVQLVRKEIGPIATFDVIQWAPGLPKTRSGKIMRRILRKIAENEIDSIGDTSTLADPSVVEDLIANGPAG